MENKDIKNYGITDINGYIHNQQIKDAEFLIRLEQSRIQMSNLRMKIKKRDMARKAEKILNKK